MVYTCSKCGRWLQARGGLFNAVRVSRRQANVLFCPRCNLRYHNPYRDTIPVWKQHPDIQRTTDGIYYRLSNAENGNTLILFHHGNWYPPTTKDIFDTHDAELIELYYKIDYENRQRFWSKEY